MCAAAEDLRALVLQAEVERKDRLQQLRAGHGEEDGRDFRDGSDCRGSVYVQGESHYAPRIWLCYQNTSSSRLQMLYTDRTPMNLSLCYRLQHLQHNAKFAQYLLACLSTLGGSNHLCNKPRQALVLARQQEALGHRLGSTDIVIRARVFQAVNIAILGAEAVADAMMQDCLLRARAAGRDGVAHFVRAVWDWLLRELAATRGEHEQRGADADAGIGSIRAHSVVNTFEEMAVESPLLTLLSYKYVPPTGPPTTERFEASACHLHVSANPTHR